MPKIESMATHLKLDIDAQMNALSGGMKRRVLLGAALLAEPDLLILDEPTNHLDIESIEWLENYLKSYRGSLLLVTHDRDFLKQVANRIVEIDRGHLYRYDCDYETYLDRREALRLSDLKHEALFDKRLSNEETWIRTGVKARRTRNEGRVRALEAMREAYKDRRHQMGQVKAINLDIQQQSGQLVLEATDVSYQWHDKPLVSHFSCLVMRGDKIGIIGPNGCGKTTLVRLLLGELEPKEGRIRRGTSLNIAYFDQLRRQLSEDETVMANVADGADFVTIQGKQKHVASYLREFLFPPEKLHQAVSTLSGGERNRLLLAKLLAKPVNLLVMDEPTNDLDLETLDLLESVLLDYPGTLLLISHDRAFINHVVGNVWVYEGQGQFNDYLGGYDTYQALKKEKKPTPAASNVAVQNTVLKKKLSYDEEKELAKLPNQIQSLEKDIAQKHKTMANPDFYQQPTQAQTEFTQALTIKEGLLTQLLERWEHLEEKKSTC